MLNFRLSVSLIIFIFLTSCKKDIDDIYPQASDSQQYIPITTTGYLASKVGKPADITESTGRSSSNCSFSIIELNTLIDTLQKRLQHDYGSYPASYLCDTLRANITIPDFFTDVPIGSVSANVPTYTEKAIEWALNEYPVPVSRVDSAARLVNYVYTQYSYGEGSLIGPKEYRNAPMKVIGAAITDNKLAGQCLDFVRFLGIIVTTKFPWWGNPVCLGVNPKNGIGHFFMGLADSHGNIYIVLDPTVNVIWGDGNGNALSLDNIQTSLVSNPGLVHSISSTVFGNKQKQFFKSSCVLYSDFVPGTASAVYEPLSGSYVVSAVWHEFDDTSGLAYRAIVAPCWKRNGFPGNTWANNCLIIDKFFCSPPFTPQALYTRYGNYVKKVKL